MIAHLRPCKLPIASSARTSASCSYTSCAFNLREPATLAKASHVSKVTCPSRQHVRAFRRKLTNLTPKFSKVVVRGTVRSLLGVDASKDDANCILLVVPDPRDVHSELKGKTKPAYYSIRPGTEASAESSATSVRGVGIPGDSSGRWSHSRPTASELAASRLGGDRQ
eukprot:935454-Pyramimonas_sp.AAC.2